MPVSRSQSSLSRFRPLNLAHTLTSRRRPLVAVFIDVHANEEVLPAAVERVQELNENAAITVVQFMPD
jgi:hypothetical protein